LTEFVLVGRDQSTINGQPKVIVKAKLAGEIADERDDLQPKVKFDYQKDCLLDEEGEVIAYDVRVWQRAVYREYLNSIRTGPKERLLPKKRRIGVRDAKDNPLIENMLKDIVAARSEGEDRSIWTAAEIQATNFFKEEDEDRHKSHRDRLVKKFKDKYPDHIIESMKI
jgi:hypothetical protein